MDRDFIFNSEIRCKVCQSENLPLYHKMRKSGRYNILEIYEKSRELGDQFSKSSVYRHFNRHFIEKGTKTTNYDYSTDDSPIVDELDIEHITLELLGDISLEELQSLENTLQNESTNDDYPILTANMVKDILLELLIQAELEDILTEDFDQRYNKAVDRALTNKYFQKFRK